MDWWISGLLDGCARGTGGWGTVVDDAEDVGGFLVVAGIQDAAKLVVAVEEGVGFVNEQGRLKLLDDAVKSRGTDVGSDDGAVGQLAEDGDQGGFAATMGGGFEADVGGDVAQLEGVGVDDPQSQGLRGEPRQDDEAGEVTDDLIEQEQAVHGLGPGGDGGEVQERGGGSKLRVEG